MNLGKHFQASRSIQEAPTLAVYHRGYQTHPWSPKQTFCRSPQSSVKHTDSVQHLISRDSNIWNGCAVLAPGTWLENPGLANYLSKNASNVKYHNAKLEKGVRGRTELPTTGLDSFIWLHNSVTVYDTLADTGSWCLNGYRYITDSHRNLNIQSISRYEHNKSVLYRMNRLHLHSLLCSIPHIRLVIRLQLSILEIRHSGSVTRHFSRPEVTSPYLL